MNDNIVNLTITDIPYGEVNREDNGLRNLNKENADIMTLDLEEFLNEVYRVTESTIIIFCGIEQVSPSKKNYFSYPCGRSKLHPTEKNRDLIQELILDNSNEGDIVFDPCCGSASHCLVSNENNRMFVGCELNEEYFNIAKGRFE